MVTGKSGRRGVCNQNVFYERSLLFLKEKRGEIKKIMHVILLQGTLPKSVEILFMTEFIVKHYD